MLRHNSARALAAMLAFPVLVMGYGQNKVQYHSFHWSYYQTAHFDIYFTKGGQLIAEFAARHVESMYKQVSGMVGHRLTDRVPIILHNTHAEFEQTNVIPLPLHEGIGGFTEVFKNRVVLPFEGSYTDFHHVLQHEMVHAVMFNMLFGTGANMTRQMGGQLPMWMSEGLAEYATLGWDLNSEFFMVDATTFGYVAPPTGDFGGFLAYKGGQLFLHFLDKIYGKGTVTRLLKAMVEIRDLPKAFQQVTHTSLEEAGEIWLRELRYLYWPELGQRQYGKTVARKLTDHGRDRSFYNLQPSLSPNGEEIAYFSDKSSWEAIYILNVKKEKVIRTVIQGGKSGGHESFHSFKSGIAWSPDGNSLAIVSKQEGRDVIHILNAKTGKVRRVLKPEVEAILSPAWSRDGRWIAFSGQREGFADIYVHDLQASTTRRLMSDIAQDDKPTFSPSGKWIAFESDRPKPILDPNPGDPLAWYDSLLSFKDIYRISVDGDSLTRVAGGPWDEKMPAYGPTDSQLVFVSNRSGLDNMYLRDDSAGTARERPLGNLLTGCFTPSLSYDGKRLAFSLFDAGGWDVYIMKDPLQKVLSVELPKTRFIRYSEDSTQGFFRPPNWANLTSFKPDSAKKDSVKKDSTAKVKTDSDRIVVDGADSSHTPADSQTVATKTPVQTTVVLAKPKSTESKTPSPFFQDSSKYRSSDGKFLARPYSPKWSLDAVNAGLGVDNYYGASGQTYLTVSDLMGDQQISMALSLNGSFANMSGFAQYDYLPLQTDFTVLGFYESQEISSVLFRMDTSSSIFSRNAKDLKYGFGLGARYPFSTFMRVEAQAIARFTQRTETLDTLDTTGALIGSYEVKPLVINAFQPSLGWSFDNTQWGIVGPVAGRRMLILAQALPPLFQDDYAYFKGEADFRAYWEFFKRYTFAVRMSAGASEGFGKYENPHRFVVGGESYTFNPHVNYYNWDRVTLQQYYFSDLDFPLRGYDFYEFVGTRKFLTNTEFRFPFLQELTVVWPLPFSIRNLMGNILLDWGGAWNDGDDAFSEMGVGVGFGLRLNLGIFVLKYTYAESLHGTDGRSYGSRDNIGPREYWSLGTEF